MDTPKPPLSTWQVLSLCVGAFGIQFGFAMPQANATRIFQNLGASLESVPLLWLAGPITGLLVQPLVGYYSDRSRARFGRRRPFFLAGAGLAAVALVLMPNATTVWMAVLTLWLLDASLNLTMGPFRAFVADQMPPTQRATGYLAYMFYASIGAVIGSLLPWTFTQLGASSAAAPGEVSDAVKYSFGLASALLFGAVCVSAASTREIPADSSAEAVVAGAPGLATSPDAMRRHAATWLIAGLAALALAVVARVRPALYVLVGCCLAYGAFLFAASRIRAENAFTTIVREIESMSASMRWLALVQFFSWFSLFAIFVYTAPAVAALHFGATSPGTPAYEAGANWAGVLFATYNGLAALAAPALPAIVRRFGIRAVHRTNLWIGAAGLLSMVFIRDPDWLLASMAGLGLAWGSIISLPYAMLANNLPSRRMGVNFGIFNIFIVIPQLLAIGVMSALLDAFAGGQAAGALVIGAVGWFLAGLAVTRVRAPD
jgi:maltose/moltooligosaccharide transporter